MTKETKDCPSVLRAKLLPYRRGIVFGYGLDIENAYLQNIQTDAADA